MDDGKDKARALLDAYKAGKFDSDPEKKQRALAALTAFRDREKAPKERLSLPTTEETRAHVKAVLGDRYSEAKDTEPFKLAGVGDVEAAAREGGGSFAGTLGTAIASPGTIGMLLGELIRGEPLSDTEREGLTQGSAELSAGRTLAQLAGFLTEPVSKEQKEGFVTGVGPRFLGGTAAAAPLIAEGPLALALGGGVVGGAGGIESAREAGQPPFVQAASGAAQALPATAIGLIPGGNSFVGGAAKNWTAGTLASLLSQGGNKLFVDPAAEISLEQASKEGVAFAGAGAAHLAARKFNDIGPLREEAPLRPPSKEGAEYFKAEQDAALRDRLNDAGVKQRPEPEDRLAAEKAAKKAHDEQHAEMAERVAFEHGQTLDRLRADPAAQAVAQRHLAAETTADKVDTFNELHDMAKRHLVPEDIDYIAGAREMRPNFAYTPTRSEGFAWSGLHHDPVVPRTAPETPAVPPRPPAAVASDVGESAMLGPNGDWSVPDRGLARKIYEGMVQQFDPVLRLERALTGEDGPISKVVRLAPGKSGAKIERMGILSEGGFVKPMVAGGIHPMESKPGRPSANDYLIALGAKQRNATLKAREGIENGSGMSDAQADAIINEANASPASTQYAKIREFNRSLNRAKLDEYEHGSGLDKATRAQWEKDWGPDYAPNETIFSDDAPGEYRGPSGSRGLGDRGPVARKAEGRTDAATNVMASGLARYAEAAMRSEKNLAGLEILKAARAHPNKKVWEEYPSQKAIPEADRENVIHMKEGGRSRFLVVRDPATRDSIKRLNTYKIDKVTQHVGTLARAWARLQTTWNLSWAPANAVMDYATTQANLLGNKDVPIGQASRMAARLANPAGYGASLKAIAEVEWGKKTEGLTPKQKSYLDLKRLGGTSSWVPWETAQQHSAELVKAVQNVDRHGFNAVKPALHAALRQIELVNKLAENVTRHRVYEAGIAEGMKPEDAAILAKTITIDFDQKGSWGPLMNTLYVFSGAGAKGAVKSMQDIKTPRKAAVLASFIAAGYAYSKMQRAARGTDENDRDAWDTQVTDQQKRNNVMIPAYTEESGKAVDVSVPLPRNYSFFWYLGSQIEAAQSNPHWNAPKAALDTVTAFGDQFNPLGNAPNMLQGATPTLIKPFVQAATNENWMGTPIHPEAPMNHPNTPAHMLSWPNTPEGVERFAKAISEWTGGDDVTPSPIGAEISPNMVEHWIQAISGGAGQDAFGLARNTQRMMQGKETLFRDWPVVKRFLKESDPIYTSRGVFYDNAGEIDHAKEVFDNAVKKGDVETVERMKADPAFQMHGPLQKYRNILGDLRKAKEATTDEAKKKDFEGKSHSLTAQFNRMYEALRRGSAHGK